MLKLFQNKAFFTTVLGLLFSLTGGDRAGAIIYDLDVTLSDGTTTGTLTGTIETVPGNNANGLGDYASGDFSFGDYEIEVAIGANSFVQNNSNSNLLIESLEVGDLTADNTGLYIDFSDPSNSQDLWEISKIKPEGDFSEGDWGFLSYFSGGNTVYESAMTVGSPPNTSFLLDNSPIVGQLGTPVASSTAVPFEFTPGVGLAMITSLWGFSCWKRRK